MLDLTLLLIVSGQLRFVIENHGHPYFYLCIALNILSLMIQFFVAIGHILSIRYSITQKEDTSKAILINNFNTFGIVLMTFINTLLQVFMPVSSKALV